MSVQAATTLDAGQRETLYALGDVLIPAVGEMPSASTADPQGKWLDKALAARPDLLPTLAELLDRAHGREPSEEARRLHAEEPDAFGALSQIVSGAYYMNLKVRKRIRYPGQGKRPPFSDEAEYDLRDGLLDPVTERGPIYELPPPSATPNGKVEPLAFHISRERRGAGRRARHRSGRRRRGSRTPPCGGRVQGRVPRAGRLAGRFRVPRRQARVGAGRRRPVEPEPEHAPPAGRLPARSLALADHARHVQRGRRLDGPLLRPVGAHASAGFPPAQRGRPRRRLAHLLRRDEAVLRADRPGDDDLRHVRRPGLPAGPAAAATAAADRAAGPARCRGHEPPRVALVAFGPRDPLRRRWATSPPASAPAPACGAARRAPRAPPTRRCSRKR